MEWVDKLFSERISSYRGLALFLIDKMYVDTQSAAAHSLAASVARERNAVDGGEDCHGQNNSQLGQGIKYICSPTSDINMKHMDGGGDLDANKRKVLKGEPCYSGEEVVKRKKLDAASSPAAVVQMAYGQQKDEKDGAAAAAAASAASFIDEEMTAYFPAAADSLEGDSVANREKLSQLRQLLEKNLKPGGGAGSATAAAPGSSSAFRPTALLPLSEAGEHEDKLPAAIAVTVGECAVRRPGITQDEEWIAKETGVRKRQWTQLPTVLEGITIPMEKKIISSPNNLIYGHSI